MADAQLERLLHADMRSFLSIVDNSSMELSAASLLSLSLCISSVIDRAKRGAGSPGAVAIGGGCRSRPWRSMLRMVP